VQVRALALEEVVGAHGDHDVEVSRRTARDPRLSFPGEPQARSVVHSRRDAHVDRLLPLGATLAAAVRAAIAHDLAGPRAVRAGATDAKESLLENHLAAAATAAADLGRRSGLRPGAVAGAAGSGLRDLDRRLEPLEHVVQLDLEVVAEIGAALAATATSRAGAGAPEEIAEEPLEDVAEVPEIAEVLETSAGRAGSHAGVAEAVVGLTLLGVREDGVGLRRLFEALLRTRIVGIAIGMIAHGNLPIGPLQCVLIHVSRDAQNLVVVALRQSLEPSEPLGLRRSVRRR
jgi:hypothetical protein